MPNSNPRGTCLVIDRHDPAVVWMEAGAALAAGGLVVFPTESYYALGARPDNGAALQRLAQVKARPASKPIALIAAETAAVARIGPIPEVLQPLVAAFWPGPLTIAVAPDNPWPELLAGAGGTVGVRVSASEIARHVAAAAGGLVTASSANRSGDRPIISITQLSPALRHDCDLILDGGTGLGGPPSTVVSATGRGTVVVHRSGAVSAAALTAVLGRSARVVGPTGEALP